MLKKCLLFTVWMLFSLSSLNTYAQVVISQVYGGGGNSGAPYTHDFVELFNRGTSPVSLNGLSLQYASATGTGSFGASASQISELPDITLQPGQYFLVQQSGGATGIALPTPDFIDPTPISMAATSGKVALVTGTTSLGCNGGSAICGSEAQSRILDLIGYGSANYFETAAAPAPSNSTSAMRANSCTDTKNNSTDFSTATPSPRNSSTDVNICNPGGETNPSATAIANPATVTPNGQTLITVIVTPGTNPASTAISVNGDLSAIGGSATQVFFNDGTNGDATADDNIFSYKATIPERVSNGIKSLTIIISDLEGRTGTTQVSVTLQSTETITPVYTIQGSGSASSITGQTITTSGIVTRDFQDENQLRGFYLQDPTGDNNATTSDGIFVFSNRTDVKEGDSVVVTGRVAEFNNSTQISNISKIEVFSTTTVVAPAFVTLPVAALSDFEKYEGMLVQFKQPLTVTENFNLGRYGEIILSKMNEPGGTDGRLFNPTNFIDPTDVPVEETENDENNIAAINEQQRENNLASIILDDDLTKERGERGENVPTKLPVDSPIPYLDPVENTLRLGTTVNNLLGIIDYAFGSFRIRPAFDPYNPNDYKQYFAYNKRPGVPSVGNGDIKVASFNVLNYFTTLNPDYDQNGPRGANMLEEFNRQQAKTIAALAAINAEIVGLIEIENNGDGESSAISNLVQTLNAKVGAGTYDYIRDPEVENGTGTDAIKVAFIYKPAIVSPLGPARADTSSVHNRPPLSQTFKLAKNGERFTAIINHFKSKSSGSGQDADQGDGQGRSNFSRIQQAKALLEFIKLAPTTNGDEDVMIIGDLNAYYEEDPMDILRAGGFVSLFDESSYSYVFQGQSGSLDHALVTQSLKNQVKGAAKWHINADEPRVLDYNIEFNPAQLYQPNPYRSSDHDPVLIGLQLNRKPVIVSQKVTKLLLSVSPNPTTGIINFVTELQNETIEATLRSPEGEIIFSGKGNATELSRQISSALQSKRGGVYILQTLIANELVNTRVVKF